MEIGKEEKQIVIEPVTEPVPDAKPAPAPEPERAPEKQPREGSRPGVSDPGEAFLPNATSFWRI